MPKVQVNDITINYEQQGTGEPLVLIPYLELIMPVMLFRSRSTQNTLPVFQWIRGVRAKQTNPKERIQLNFLPMMWLHS